MRSLNVVALMVVSSVVLACGSSTPEPETPEATAEEAPADVTTAPPAADAGPPAQ
jgi:hypothetical protein